ncbi:MAG: LysM peptidoglycan-binding domain-containing protein [Patescibacteria group bacterium]
MNKEQLRERLKSALKFSKTNPELFIGFFFGFVLILVLAGVLFIKVMQGPKEISDKKMEEDQIEVITKLPEEPVAEQAPDLEPETEDKISLPVVYEVQAGDSSWKIAKAFYGCGEAYVEIEKMNGLEANALLEIGQKLVIADLENAQISSPSSGEESSSYEVLQGDCLWSIALEQTGNPYNWTKIYESNKELIGDNPDLIYPQTKLIIPNPLY